jgi:YidC/Oxa1 family membrane protein insertase
MGVSMIIQQRLSSASSQNQQQKTMAFIMPIVFLFLFYNFSSGLNLYYLVFNIFTIAQELIIKRPKNQEPAAA